MAVKILLRHYQNVNIYGTPIIYTGASPATLKAVAGTVPVSDWRFFGNEIDVEDGIALSWREGDGSGEYGPEGETVKQTASGSITITGEAYRFIKAWCVDHVAAPLNSIEVLFRLECGDIFDWRIQSDQLKWCEGESLCEFQVNPNQIDPVVQCIQRTVINDNHQGWFQERPVGGKKHPRFSYCNEHRPVTLLVVLWLFMALNTPIIFALLILLTIVYIVTEIINKIIGLLSLIVVAITTLIPSFSGGVPTEPEWNVIPTYKPSDFIDIIKQFYVESAGCGREHPAPLIRDYIQNVCTKCGLRVDAYTCPIFFSPIWEIDFITSTGVNLRGKRNPYYNACFLNTPIGKGIRRYESLQFFSGAVKDDSTFWDAKNAPGLALSDFLDLIKDAFNHEWRMRKGSLYFWRKDWYENGDVILDFTKNSADRLRMLEGICFEWNGKTQPALSIGLWTMDAIDTCGNQCLNQNNGISGNNGQATVTYASTDDNPNFKGENDRSVGIGAGRFRFDGAKEDYIYDALQVVVKTQIIAPWMAALMREVDTLISEIANYALVMRDETAALPKILIWDEVSYLGARCVKDVVPIRNALTTTEPEPEINPLYNPDANNSFKIESFYQRHTPNVKVLGGGSFPPGIYEVRSLFGALIAQNSARLVNYPMYYNPGYIGTLWDNFHYIDDPRRNPGLNQAFEVKIEACCDMIKRMGLIGDGTTAELGATVLVDSVFYPNGTIKEIELNLDPENEVGQHIKIKGTLGK